MQRISNNTVSADDILRVRDQVIALQRSIADIQFAMTLEEQQGLYSLIRNLEFETWHERFAINPSRPTDIGIQNNRLKELLKQVKTTDISDHGQ